jgi:hypothetical protein
MTRIRTGNNRRRAKADRTRFQKGLVSLDLETIGLGADFPGMMKIAFRDGRTDTASIVPLDVPGSVDAIARIIASFADAPPNLFGLAPHLEPIHLLHGRDNRAGTSRASEHEKLIALTRDVRLPFFPTSHRPEDDAASQARLVDQVIGMGRRELTDEERLAIEDTLAMFAKPDEGVDPQYAEWASRQPTYDEFVESLPDGLPDDPADD